MVTLILFRVCGPGDSSVKYSLPSFGSHSEQMDYFSPINEDIRQS